MNRGVGEAHCLSLHSPTRPGLGPLLLRRPALPTRSPQPSGSGPWTASFLHLAALAIHPPLPDRTEQKGVGEPLLSTSSDVAKLPVTSFCSSKTLIRVSSFFTLKWTS